MAYNKNTVDTIEKAILIDFANDMEPTDSEGWEMEGTVNYQGKDYPVELYARSEDSYERQAAIQIAEALRAKPESN